MRCVFVGDTMAGEEGDRDVVVFEDVDRCGGVAPRCEWVENCDRDVAF